jgi:hypothetical protein
MQPQLTLRDLLWLTLVVALALGCWFDRMWLLPAHCMVQARRAYWPRFNDHEHSLRTVDLWPPDKAEIPWLRRLLGDGPTESLMYDPEKDPHGIQLREAKRLFPEATIWGWPRSKDLPEGIKALGENRRITI